MPEGRVSLTAPIRLTLYKLFRILYVNGDRLSAHRHVWAKNIFPLQTWYNVNG